MMFVVLTLCASMVSLFMARGTIYRYSMSSFLLSQKIHLQLQSGLAVAQSMMESDADSSQNDSQQPAVPGGEEGKLLMKLLLGRSQKITSEMFGGKSGVIIEAAVQPESGDDVELCMEALEGCPVEAIGEDGNE